MWLFIPMGQYNILGQKAVDSRQKAGGERWQGDLKVFICHQTWTMVSDFSEKFLDKSFGIC